MLNVYRITKLYPENEIYGLTSQFRRAATSITANIAAGFAKPKADKLRFLAIAKGSLEERCYYLKLTTDLDYVSDSIELNNTNLLHCEVSKLLEACHRGGQDANY